MNQFNFNNLKFKQALFVPSGTYNQQMIRPYQTYINDYKIFDVLKNATDNGQNINNSIISPYSFNIFKPSSQAEAPCNIENGWDTPRFRFVLEIDEINNLTNSVIIKKIVQGYTSHMGIGFNGSIDPNMILYFNNVITLSVTSVNNYNGIGNNYHVAESSQIIRNYAEPYSGQFLNVITPNDVLNTLQLNNVLNNDTMLMDDYIDLRNNFNLEGVRKTYRKWSNSNEYLASVMKAFRNTYNNNLNPYVDSLVKAELIGEAKGFVKDLDIKLDPFFENLISNYDHFRNGGSITYGELTAIYPEIDYLSNFIMIKDTNKVSSYELHQRGQTEHWSGSNIETQWVNILTHSLPSLMINYLISRIAFVATNETINSEFLINVTDVASVVNELDITKYVKSFIYVLEKTIFNSLTNQNYINFNLMAMIDIKGESRFTISVGGLPSIDYVSPSFSDSLFTPLFTYKSELVTKIGQDLNFLSEVISDTTNYNNSEIRKNIVSSNSFNINTL